MSTKLKQYILLRSFGEDLIREIQVSDDPWERDYFHYISGYALGLIHALGLDKSEASNIKTEAKELIDRAAEECRRVKYVHKYNRAVEYVRGRVKDADPLISAASTDDLISLYDIGLHSVDCTGEDFYDLYDDLLKKYSIGEKKGDLS